MLSDSDARTLDELERQLAAENPELARLLVDGPPYKNSHANWWWLLASLATFAGILLGALFGLVVVAAGLILVLAAIGNIYHRSHEKSAATSWSLAR